jgi:hypothetical protein
VSAFIYESFLRHFFETWSFRVFEVSAGITSKTRRH